MPTHRAIAAVMNGVDPLLGDIAAMSRWRQHLSERMIHQCTAAALQQALLSRPRQGARIGHKDTPFKMLQQAHGLALALAADADGDRRALASIISAPPHTWLEAAALVGRMQVRFLEQACAQITLVADHLPISDEISYIRAGDLLREDGKITDTTKLLPDVATADPEEAGENNWLHATSTVDIAGRRGSVIVDAGPSALPCAWSARIAAPVSVHTRIGRWPAFVVRDALHMHEDAVRSWVGSMSRQLSGFNDEDLLLKVGPPLRNFLISPASAAIGRCAADLSVRPVEMPAAWVHHGNRSSAADTGSAAAGAYVRALEPVSGGSAMSRQSRVEVLRTLRNLPNGRGMLREDVTLADAVALTDIRREELTILSAAAAQDLLRPVEVISNIDLPDWEDVDDLVADLTNGSAAVLNVPLIGWTDRDIVKGGSARLSLVIVCRRGTPVRTRSGFGVFLAAGTTVTVLTVERSRKHATVYLHQQIDPAAATPEASVSDAA